MSLKLANYDPPPSPSSAPPAPAGTKWITLKTAAARSGWNEGYIRRLCGDRWMSQGLAELRSPPEGGKPAWHVREDADAKFASVKFPEQMSAEMDMRSLTSRQRETILLREAILRDWEAACRGALAMGITREAATTQFLARVEIERQVKVSIVTLYRWYKSWRAAGRAGLLDARTTAQQVNKVDRSSQFFAYLRDLFLTPRKLSKRICYEIARQKAAESGWEVPSERTARRYLEALPDSIVQKKRHGEDAYVAKVEPFIQRDYSTLASNELWCGDHHRFDVMIAVPGSDKPVRPWLTAWQDMRSRKIVGYSIFASDPNTDTILRAFVMGCKSHGVPAGVYIDNGKDYDARALQGFTKQQRRKAMKGGDLPADARLDGAFQILAVQCTHVWAYHGQSKPIERFFGTVCERFSKLWETYCGNTTANKPENLQQQIAAGKAPTLEEFTAAFSEWLSSDYHGRLHLGDSMEGRTPDQVFEAHLSEKKTLPEELLEFACLPRVGPVKIGRQGVTWQGLHFGAVDAQIQKRFGEKVMLAIDERSLNRVLVIGMDGRLICPATINKSLPVNANKDDLKAAITEKKANRRTLKEYNTRRPRMADDHHALAARAAIERQKRQPRQPVEATPPPSLKPHRTAFDDQLREIAQAMRPERIAVGAESLSPSMSSDVLRDAMKPIAQDAAPDTFSILRSLNTRESCHD